MQARASADDSDTCPHASLLQAHKHGQMNEKHTLKETHWCGKRLSSFHSQSAQLSFAKLTTSPRSDDLSLKVKTRTGDVQMKLTCVALSARTVRRLCECVYTVCVGIHMNWLPVPVSRMLISLRLLGWSPPRSVVTSRASMERNTGAHLQMKRASTSPPYWTGHDCTVDANKWTGMQRLNDLRGTQKSYVSICVFEHRWLVRFMDSRNCECSSV